MEISYNQIQRLFRIISFVISVTILTSCGSNAIKVQLDAAKSLNPDPAFNALPVRLKIYQLSDLTAFHEATFRQLWKADVLTLGASLLEKKELTINPGGREIFKMQRHPQAEYIAVVGVFRQYQSNSWKAFKHLPGKINTFIKPIHVIAKNHKIEVL